MNNCTKNQSNHQEPIALAPSSSVGLSSQSHLSKTASISPIRQASVVPNPHTLQDGDTVYLLETAVGGSLARLAPTKVKSMENHHHFVGMEGTRKGIPTKPTISRASRRRLLRLCARLNRSKIDENSTLFVTLTYGSDKKALSWNWTDYKRHLNNFNTRLRRKFGNTFFGIWRVEWQKRGVGHFHMVIMFVDGFKAYIDKDWLAKSWNEITEGNQDHLAAGTSVERARSWKHTGGYFSKTMAYIGKDEAVPKALLNKGLGRHWGYINKDLLNRYINIKTDSITNKTFFKLKRIFYNYLKRQAEQKKKGIKYDHSHWKMFKHRLSKNDMMLNIHMEYAQAQRLLSFVS